MRLLLTALTLSIFFQPIALAETQASPTAPSQGQPISTEAAIQENTLSERSEIDAYDLQHIMPGSKLYIDTDDYKFRQIMSAAILKKKVPIRLVSTPRRADFLLTTATEAKKEGTGERVTKLLLFGWFAGKGKSFEATINITNLAGDVVFARSVEKGSARKAARKIAAKLKKHIEQNQRQN